MFRSPSRINLDLLDIVGLSRTLVPQEKVHRVYIIKNVRSIVRKFDLLGVHDCECVSKFVLESKMKDTVADWWKLKTRIADFACESFEGI